MAVHNEMVNAVHSKTMVCQMAHELKNDCTSYEYEPLSVFTESATLKNSTFIITKFHT